MKLLLLTKRNAQNYYDAVVSFGHEAAYETDDLTAVDGVILCGGSDIHPAYYGQQICGAVEIDEERDAREYRIASECIRRRIPLLGICRGHQLLNVLFGGTLIQHLENAALHNKTHAEHDISHEVRASADSVFMRLYGERFVVNTSHHQAVDRLGEGLQANLFAPDGVIEGFVHESLPILAVQWHPERMMPPHCEGKLADGKKIFEYFFEMIEKKRRDVSDPMNEETV